MTVTEQNNSILLNEVIWKLKQQSLNDFYDSSVSYLHEKTGVYVFGFMIPNEPKEEELLNDPKYIKSIPKEALKMNGNYIYLHLKFRKRIGSKL